MHSSAALDSRWAGPQAPARIPDVRLVHVIVVGAVLIAALAAVSLRVYESDASHDPLALGCGLSVLALILYARYALRFAWMSASVVYLLLFWMFHYGLAFTAVLVPDVLTRFGDRAIEWLYWPNARLSMLLGLLGAAGFVLGLATIPGRAGGRRPAARERVHEAPLYVVGWLILLAGVGLSGLAIFRSGGLEIFGLGYREFRATVLGPTGLFSFIQVAQLGGLLALCGAGGRRWFKPFLTWSIFAGMLLLLGLRNEAMVPLLTFMILLARRGVRFRRGPVLAGALVALVAMPAIGAVRTVGVRNLSAVAWTDVTPLSTFVELGGTLRAVNAYVDWIAQGDPYLLGQSYWAPFDRHLLVFVLPDRDRIPVDRDPRVPGQHMVLREGAVGTAATGEAYYNFGPMGPVLFFGGVGLLFGWLDRRAAPTPYQMAILGIALFAFYWNIRGQWISLPAQVTASLLVLGVCYLLRTDRPAVRS